MVLSLTIIKSQNLVQMCTLFYDISNFKKQEKGKKQVLNRLKNTTLFSKSVVQLLRLYVTLDVKFKFITNFVL